MRITFGERLEDLLQDDSMSADAFAKEIGVSNSTVSRWIRENTPAKLTQLLKIASFFQYSVDYICGRTDIESKFNPVTPNFPTRLIDLIEKSNETKAFIFQKLGLNRHALYDWRKGTIPLSTQLINIADYFDVTIDYLIGL
ncbi:MAG: helix-turn-helix domain-containing protein [Firmicutes bacterium]|nr:helix-turn-helix domain-containing protein [Bacillota bacterium]